MGLEEHWDAAYARGDATKSWTEAYPAHSLHAVEAVVPSPDAPIVDAGGGSSRLAGALLERGNSDVTVVDISAASIELAQRRLGRRAKRISWITADLLTWRPERRYSVWHDRAVLHFFTDPAERRRYAEVLRSALEPGGHAIIATFGPNGPERCSGLAVHRSSAHDVLDLLGAGFVMVDAESHEHRTPSDRLQEFSWLIAQRTR